MAIEIIPKTEEKEVSPSQVILSSISIILLVTAIIAPVLFWFLGQRASQIAEETDRIIENRKTEEFLEIDARVRQYQQKISDYNVLSGSAQTPLRMLEAVEASIHPGVILTGLRIDMTRGEISANGAAENIVVYDQQVRIFKSEGDFGNTSIPNFTIADGGQINFPVIFSFRPETYMR